MAFQKPKLDEHEYRFDRVKSEEFEDCFLYELQRCRLPRLRASIIEEARELDETGESAESTFARKLDLQAELDLLKQYERPWLKLSDSEKMALKRQNGPKKGRESYEPVQLVSRLRGLERLRMLASNGCQEKIEIVIDWSASNTQLKKSFSRLLDWNRKHRGRSSFEVERRGERQQPVEMDLFSLAVWRCSKHGIKYSKMWDLLKELRGKVALGERNERMLSKFSKDIDSLVNPLGTA